jgi:succinate dehydrogenase / fumarate reductase cytochrome b subunit
MALAINRENFVLHRLHSLTGIVPVGYYMAQHLALNTFTLSSPAAFNGVIEFFEGMPKHLLLTLEVVAIWLPLLFHSIYGLFITGRAKQNFIGTKYGWSENRMYWLQRASGIFLFFALIVHVSMTTVRKYVTGDADVIKYAAWQEKLTSFGGIWLIFYVLLVAVASYHLAYGIWNFCVRWGITVSDKAQIRIQKVSLGAFFALTLMGWGALAGFLIHKPTAGVETGVETRIIKPASLA